MTYTVIVSEAFLSRLSWINADAVGLVTPDDQVAPDFFRIVASGRLADTA